jgi:hypothetical protein
MELPTPCRAASRKTFWFLSGLAVLVLILTAVPSRASAQTLVVADFSGKRNTKRVGRAARSAIVKALSNEGASLVSYRQYIRKAKRNRISARRALRARSIKILSGKMNLSAVITGSVKKRGRRYIVTVSAYDSDGRRLVKKNYRLKRPRFPASVASKFAGLVVGKLGGGGGGIAEPEPAPVEPPPPVEPEPETTTDTAAVDTTGGGTSDAFLPPWARTDKKEGDTTAGTTTADTSTGTATPEVAKPAPTLRRRRKKKAGAVPEILISAGMSMHSREGLHPRHESGIFPGVRIDGRFFLGAFLDTTVVKDIGFGGMFDMSLGLKYGIPDGDTWNSTQMQWGGELLYRLALNDVALQPAFMLRVGYGSTSCVQDTDETLAVSAGYSYPYAALDIYLMLYKPVLRMNVSGGYLFIVSPSEDLSGDGSGFTVRAGIDLDLFDNLHIGLGWEMFQFTIKDDDIGETSDMYHGFFGRIGWNYK